VHKGVTGITLTAGGAGYTSDPTCTLTGGGGSPAATCTSIINGVDTLAPQAYPAQVGWDFATGIGTVNACNLVESTAWLPTVTAAQPGEAPKPEFRSLCLSPAN
jgi:hypothetical protein